MGVEVCWENETRRSSCSVADLKYLVRLTIPLSLSRSCCWIVLPFLCRSNPSRPQRQSTGSLRPVVVLLASVLLALVHCCCLCAFLLWSSRMSTERKSPLIPPGCFCRARVWRRLQQFEQSHTPHTQRRGHGLRAFQIVVERDGCLGDFGFVIAPFRKI